MLIKCPECKQDVSDKAENCPKCGFDLTSKPVTESKGKLSRCIGLFACGKKIPEDAKTCPHCGARQLPKKVKKIILWIPLAVGAIVLFFIFFVILIRMLG